MRRLIFSLTFVLVSFFFQAGCGPLPKPFKPNISSTPNSLTKLDSQYDVVVALSGEVPEHVRGLLLNAVTLEITRYDLIAHTKDRGKSKYVLDIFLEGWRGGIAEAPPFRVGWSLKNRSGELIKSEVFNVFGTASEWFEYPRLIIKKIAKKISGDVADLLLAHLGAISQFGQSPNKVWIEPVVGGEQNKNNVLFRAITFSMKESNVQLAAKKEEADQILTGYINIGPSVKKNKNVEIEWILKTYDEREIGRVHQSKAVPERYLSDQWNIIAANISKAVAPAIRDMSLTSKKSLKRDSFK